MIDKTSIIFNMETADPDDVLTLCMLSHHPRVNLCGITITPGSIQQVALVSHVLKLLELDIPIASKNILHPKECVSEWHYKWLGKIPMDNALKGISADRLIGTAIANDIHTKIVSGAGLGCVAQYLDQQAAARQCARYPLEEIVVQGGFAGDSVVPPEHRLAKFAGKETCPTFNLNADRKAAQLVIDTNQIRCKRFVSKNVCHGVIYDQEMHERIKPFKDRNVGLAMMYAGMEHYLQNKSGKAFHDPLAACVAIDATICGWAEVALYTQKGEWGSRLIERNDESPDTFISIAVDRARFEQILVGLDIDE